MRLGRILLALAAGVGCGNITATDEGVTELRLELPSPMEVEIGDTVQVVATPLDAEGAPVAVPVFWIALDTNIVVDSVAGLLTGAVAGATGKLVARTGDLYSSTISVTVHARADTLLQVAPANDTVAVGETESADLTVRLEGGDPLQPLSGRSVVYQVVHPIFAHPDDRTIELTGNGLVRAQRTTANGSPAGIRLRRREGFSAPDSAIVTVSAWRPGGSPIPGTGTRFIIHFAAQ